MLKPGGRSRAGSLSSPGPAPPPPRLGVSGLYTDYMERRKYSESGSISPPCIPSPPPPVTTSTLETARSYTEPLDRQTMERVQISSFKGPVLMNRRNEMGGV